jgi:hypothetical protein
MDEKNAVQHQVYKHLAFSGLRSGLARILFFATGDIKLLRKAKRCIPKTLACI